jgi:diadenosine tetraphosphate (Ap4A) HIT family hydrolase
VYRRVPLSRQITIAANESGRLWTNDVERWNALCSPEGGIVCRDEGLPSGMHLLAETPMVEAVSAESVPLPGYVCVTSKKHAVEPFDLGVEDQRWYWTDAMLVARGVADVRRPTKMNYEIHGNTIPHLHMHLFPRTAGDVYVGYVIHHRVEFEQSTQELEDLKTGIVARLREAKRLA